MKQKICLFLVLLFPVMAARSVDRYVATNGTHDGVFTNWAGAATNIQAAVDMATTAGDYVWVSNGVYSTTNGVITTGVRYAVVAITNANIITLKSVNGPLVTIIDAGGVTAVPPHIGVYISLGGTIDGFTVRNGYSTDTSIIWNGAGIALYGPCGGTVTNCYVYNNTLGYGHGGGIGAGSSSTGNIYNCLIYSNSALLGGGGVMARWAVLTLNNCSIWGNKSTSIGGYAWVCGGGIKIEDTTLSMRNCLVYSNLLSIGINDVGGGGVYLSGNYGKMVENCTITENTSAQMAGGIYILNDGLAGNVVVLNSIIYNNFTTNVSVYPDVYTPTNQLTNCCFGDTNGIPNWNINGNITNNPVFVGATTNNYRLKANSPCINTGMNQDWMTGAVDLDGRRRIDLLGGQVDRGCYEYLINGTIFIIR